MKGLLAVPTSNHFTTLKQPMICVLSALLNFKNIGWQVDLAYNELPWIEDSRNNLFANAKEYDWMLWIDSDMVFSPLDAEKIIHKLLEKEYDMLTGVYYMGNPPYHPLIYKELVTGTGVTYWHNYPQDKDFQVAACGFGFVAMSKKIINGMPLRPFNRERSWIGNVKNLDYNNLGEDLSFCLKAGLNGFKIWCDPTIQLGHLRIIEINKKYVEEKRKQE